MALITDLTRSSLIDAQEDAAFRGVWIIGLVLFFCLLVLLALLVLVQLLKRFEALVASLTLIEYLCHCTRVG